MVAFSNICFAAIAASGVLAAPTPGPLKKFAELKRVPAQWTTQGRAPGEAMINARIGVKQNNIEGLQQKLLDISHPNSANYGKWLSKEEVDKYTAPADSHVAAVKAWLASAGVNNVAHNNDWLEFTAPVSKMESLLDAEYEWFIHASTGLRLPRTKQFSVPENLHSVIDVITPTTALYHNMGPEKSDKGGGHSKRQTDTDLTTPAYIRSAYNVDYTGKGSQTIATSAFQSVGASHSDFAAFARRYQPGLADFTDISVNGATNNGQAGNEPEGNLDTQYAGAMASPNPSQFLSCGPANPFEDGLLAFSQYLNSASSPPSTVSTSYGDEENNFDTSYLDRICNEFMKAGSRGVSVFFSSGDSGVGGNRESSCPDGFYAVFPASCPYITSIGGTEFDSGTEVVADFSQYNEAITSPGGGYSNYFAAPSYNAKVTAAYAQSLPSSIQSQFNASGRGYPDLSLISVQFQTEVNGQVGTVLGTSASSPSTAGLFSVLNDYLHSQGKPVLGFLNPLLYSGKINSAINDITSGSNAGCDSNGFPAQQGWAVIGMVWSVLVLVWSRPPRLGLV